MESTESTITLCIKELLEDLAEPSDAKKMINSLVMSLRDELGLRHSAELPKAVRNLSRVPFDQVLVSGYQCSCCVSIISPGHK